MDNIDVARSAPGCFGSASVFSHDSKVCQTCGSFKECAGASLKRLEEIKSIVNVSDLIAKHQKAQAKASAARISRRAGQAKQTVVPVKEEPKQPVIRQTTVEKVTFEIDEEHQAIIANIQNKKAANLAIVICKSNLLGKVRERLTQKRNPFESSGPQFLRVAFAMLLSGGFTRASLRQELITEFGWTDATAASHVSIVCSLLPAFDIMQEIDERFVLTPSKV